MTKYFVDIIHSDGERGARITVEAANGTEARALATKEWVEQTGDKEPKILALFKATA